MGIHAMAANLGMDAGTIRQVHEPYLMARGYVVRTSRGRVATRLARRLYGAVRQAA